MQSGAFPVSAKNSYREIRETTLKKERRGIVPWRDELVSSLRRCRGGCGNCLLLVSVVGTTTATIAGNVSVRPAAVPITLALLTGPVFVISTEVEKSFALNLCRFARQSKRC